MRMWINDLENFPLAPESKNDSLTASIVEINRLARFELSDPLILAVVFRTRGSANTRDIFPYQQHAVFQFLPSKFNS